VTKRGRNPFRRGNPQRPTDSGTVRTGMDLLRPNRGKFVEDLEEHQAVRGDSLAPLGALEGVGNAIPRTAGGNHAVRCGVGCQPSSTTRTAFIPMPADGQRVGRRRKITWEGRGEERTDERE
jgi:hypothetical protein